MSTSKLQEAVGQLLRYHLREFTVLENVRPEWLATGNDGRLELDFYIPELNAAIEVQGRQHYEFVEFYHRDPDGFAEQQCRDALKNRACANAHIQLYEVVTLQQMDDILERLIPEEYATPKDEKYAQTMARYKLLEEEREAQRRKPLWVKNAERYIRIILKEYKFWPRPRQDRIIRYQKRLQQTLSSSGASAIVVQAILAGVRHPEEFET